MKIDDEDLEEFKRIYAAEFGEELSQAEASEVASRFVDLYVFLSLPLPSELEEIERTKQPPGTEQTPSAFVS